MVYRVCSQEQTDGTKVVVIYSREDGMSRIFELVYKDFSATKRGGVFTQPAFRWGQMESHIISSYYSRINMTLGEYKQYSFLIGANYKDFKALKGAPYIHEALMDKVKEQFGLNVGVFNMGLGANISLADFNILYALCKK